ncbi:MULTISPECIES: hypothetical protein [unclassified Streptomyces]|uniref:hypothetical protein n=1 Tax=unclassified Streptomyces TaxID=2593676 RepID=UPI002258911A|nr:hypothetical protein [Streptomyces sp. NBC_00452]MCX5056798.1 hypothetical protein [Streptomyces sp. NBC_00452]
MTTPAVSSSCSSADEIAAPPLGQLLLRSAAGRRDRTAVQALVEEEKLLALDNVRGALVTKADGVMTCRWEVMARRLYTLGLDDGDRAFLGLVLSIVGVRQGYLSAVEYLDERRLKIMLHAMIRLTSNDRLAIGTRL